MRRRRQRVSDSVKAPEQPPPKKELGSGWQWLVSRRFAFTSLNVRLLRRILVVSALLTVIATGIQLYADYRKDIERLDDRIASIKSSHLPALALSVWQVDPQLIETQLQSIRSLPDVHAVELKTAYGGFYRAGAEQPAQDPRSYDVALIFERGRRIALGSLRVSVDLGSINDRTMRRLLVMLATEGVRIFFVSFGILLIVQFTVSRHLADIAAYLRHFRTDSLDEPLSLKRGRQKTRDELDVFVAAFNGMRENLRAELEQLEDVKKSLQVSEETHRLALDAAHDGLWDWDIKEGTVTYSPAWCRILGEQEVAPEYETWASRIHPDDREATLASLQEHLAGRSDTWSAEHRLKTHDGNWIWVLGRGRVVALDADGKPKRMVGTMSDISQTKEKEELVWHQANYDALTELPNRTLFHELLNREISFSVRAEKMIWVLFLDLDGFKEVNDVLGHQSGDRLLTKVANRLIDTVRQCDVVARLGGDEFVVMLAGKLSSADVDRIAGKLIEVVSKPYDLAGQEVFITTSIGIASYPNDASNAGDLIKFADQSMYEAKKQGKNQFHYFTPALEVASALRLQMSSDLRKAISANEFELYYQPVIDLASERACKAEALLRWNHPEKGEISPAGFVPIAEETGVIIEIGDWVFDNALQQMAQWSKELCRDFQLSINVSPLQLKSRAQSQSDWLSLLAQYGISGSAVVIEITEGMLVEQEPEVADKLARCRQAGVQIAIDDFGTGYSSLAYLKKLDIDFLKIDRSFTRNLGTCRTDESLVEAMIVMAHKLGITVIAEGVETELQKDLLKKMQCDYAQGHYFARPMPADDFERYVASVGSAEMAINRRRRDAGD